jgi:diguanylate cyclase (GGDEF)-like protein
MGTGMESYFGTVWRWLAMQDTPADRASAQLRELMRQLPLIHLFLPLNVVAVGWSHYDDAPSWLTILVPSFLIGFSVVRLLHWQRVRKQKLTDAATMRILRRTPAISIAFALAYTSWGLALSQYGGPIGQAHVAFFLAVTLLGYIACMLHLPQAALGIAAFSIVPYIAYYGFQGQLMFSAIAIDLLLVTVILFRILMNSFGEFQSLQTAKKEAERLHAEISLLAHTDMLTGLPNRRLFFRELDKMMSESARSSRPLSLGIIDLDHFKTANDTFGHLLGDELLEMVGARLRKTFGHGQLIARLGGDEFAFAVMSPGSAAVKLAEEACRLLSEPYRLSENVIHIGASCGIASTLAAAESARSLYDNADYALYQSKTYRPGSVTVYSLDHEHKVNAERAVEMALQAADFLSELDLHLQPIVSTTTGRIVAVESLARWTSPQLGAVRPDVFIPVAERAGLTHNMTMALFGKALTYLRFLPRNVQLSFNLSALDMTSEATVLAVIAAVRKSNINPSRLLLELTETAAIRDFSAAEQSIRTLRAFGFSIALDDFGTGQSSLSYLHRLPIDKVKLDRSFLLEAGGSSGRDLLGGVVKLCHSLKMSCVAEGVEDAEQLRFLQEIGCDLYQGYHYAKPMPIAELLAFLPGRVSDQRLAS